MPNVFAVSVFFICFRECLETAIIVSVLLAFIKQTLGPEHDARVRKMLVRQVWCGVAAGIFICVCIGAGVIATFYTAGKRSFEGAESIWEGVFGIVASIIITVMGAALLDTKNASMPLGGRFKRWGQKYAMFILPLVTILREGIEAVLFIAGVGLGLPATSFPLAVICGLGAGALIGFLIYKGGNRTSLQIFLVVSTCFLYLVAAGLFSKGVWKLELNTWKNIAGEGAVEAGTGPGSYDIRQSVWHVNCCDPSANGDGGWGIFNSLFGWQSSATYGSVISYNLYWLVVIVGFLYLGYKERNGEPAASEDIQSDASSGQDELAGKKVEGAASSAFSFFTLHICPVEFANQPPTMLVLLGFIIFR